MKIKKVNIPIFHAKIVMIKTDCWSKVNDKYKMEIGDFSAVVWKDEKKRYLKLFVAFLNKPTNAVIAHETVHLVNHIFINKGINLDRFEDEPQAYLTGFIVEQIEKFLK